MEYLVGTLAFLTTKPLVPQHTIFLFSKKKNEDRKPAETCMQLTLFGYRLSKVISIGSEDFMKLPVPSWPSEF